MAGSKSSPTGKASGAFAERLPDRVRPGGGAAEPVVRVGGGLAVFRGIV